MSQGIVVGIDLGTTNSSVGYVRDGQPTLIPVDGSPLMPSVVGLGSDGTVLVGSSAHNQAVVYPERTVRSVKRRMGEDVLLELGDQRLRPEEISALILGRLKRAAEQALGEPVRRAVITVPAYFSDAQRQATKEAGEIAGFQVERILHEPTAASLCYDQEDQRARRVLVYDLGGGTFDVSIVRIEPGITEVMASHGDTALGGDDFDALLAAHLLEAFSQEHGLSVSDDRKAMARLARAAEEAKIRLSVESYTRVMEEHLAESLGVSRHLDREVSRHEYEALIAPLLGRTCQSVQRALAEAGMLASELDEVILVGGSSRTPRVSAMLSELLGRAPRMDVNPDQAVALGAALQAARVAGDRSGRILVDITPFTFGTAAMEIDEQGYPGLWFQPIIRRNNPLPTRQTAVFATMVPGQAQIDVKVYQGEHREPERNLLLGRFTVTGLDPRAPEGSPILFDLALDLDGILKVSVIERHTGLRKDVEITDAFRRREASELEAARQRVERALELGTLDALDDLGGLGGLGGPGGLGGLTGPGGLGGLTGLGGDLGPAWDDDCEEDEDDEEGWDQDEDGGGAEAEDREYGRAEDDDHEPGAGQEDAAMRAGQGSDRAGQGSDRAASGQAAESVPSPRSDPMAHRAQARVKALIGKVEACLPGIPDQDRQELKELSQSLTTAFEAACVGRGTFARVESLASELEDVLFYLE